MARSLASAGLLLAFLAGTASAQDAPLTFRQAVAEALSSSPLLRGPDDDRTLADIRARQTDAQFGLSMGVGVGCVLLRTKPQAQKNKNKNF